MSAEKQTNELVENIVKSETVDPVLAFLTKWKDRIINIILVVALIAFFGNFYYESRITNLKNAADNFSSLQTALEKVRDKSDQESNKVLKDNLKNLLNEPYPYSEIGKTYQALNASERGTVAEKEALLNSNIKKSDQDRDLIFSELASFVLARSLLGTEKQDLGLKNLKDLASNSKYLAVSAVNVLARLDQNLISKQDLLALVDAVLKRQPEQTENLKGLKQRFTN